MAAVLRGDQVRIVPPNERDRVRPHAHAIIRAREGEAAKQEWPA